MYQSQISGRNINVKNSVSSNAEITENSQSAKPAAWCDG